MALRGLYPGADILLAASSDYEVGGVITEASKTKHLQDIMQSSFNNNRQYHQINKLYCTICIWKKKFHFLLREKHSRKKIV